MMSSTVELTMQRCSPQLDRIGLLAPFLCAAVALAYLPTARAQDMTFGVDETSGGSADKGAAKRAAPPSEGPPSEALANALRQYQSNRFEEAAVQCKRVIDGRRETPGNKQKAQFFLAKSLFEMGLYQASLSIFDEITDQGAGHLHFSETLPWLAKLSEKLPEPAGVIEKVGRYPIEDIEALNDAENADVYQKLLYLMGRFQYGELQFGPAVELFAKIDSSSPDYVRAKFFEGISQVRMRKARPAIAAFRAIIDGVDKAKIDDKARMRNLAWISLARVYYTAANSQANQADPQMRARLVGQAVEAWNNVDDTSEYWLDALFESSWAFFLADEFSRALGNVHTLYSPYFPDSYYPEAIVLKAVTFFVNCQMENAEAMIGQFHERFDPVRTELEATLSRFEDNAQFFDFLKKVRAGEAELTPRIRAIVSTALSDRTLLAHVEYVTVLDKEAEMLEKTSAEFKASAVGTRVTQDIGIAKGFAIETTGDLARGRYKRLILELQDLGNQVDTVEIEMLAFIRGQLDQEAQQQMTAAAQARGGDVEVDEEHQMWPFNGEYWRDELGYYRQQVTNQCGR